MKIKGVIFDADGTLFDSMPSWKNIGRRCLLSFGITGIEEDLDEILFKMSVDEACEYVRKRFCVPCEAEQIKAEVKRLLKGLYANEIPFKAGAEAFLKRLREMGIPMSVATAGERELLTSALKRYGVEKYFSAILTCDELKTDKTKPEIYYSAARIMKTKPEETLVFEDALYAIKTAKDAGFIVAGVEDETSLCHKENIISLADFYIKDFTLANDLIG